MHIYLFNFLLFAGKLFRSLAGIYMWLHGDHGIWKLKEFTSFAKCSSYLCSSYLSHAYLMHISCLSSQHYTNLPLWFDEHKRYAGSSIVRSSFKMSYHRPVRVLCFLSVAFAHHRSVFLVPQANDTSPRQFFHCLPVKFSFKCSLILPANLVFTIGVDQQLQKNNFVKPGVHRN